MKNVWRERVARASAEQMIERTLGGIAAILSAVMADNELRAMVWDQTVQRATPKGRTLEELDAEERQWKLSGPAKARDGHVVDGSLAFRLKCAVVEGRIPTWFLRKLAEASESPTAEEIADERATGHVEVRDVGRGDERP